MPIRLRLTIAFALAMTLVLAVTALFVYVRVRDDLNESISIGLATRAAAVAASGQTSAGAVGDGEEGFAQLIAADGRVLDATGGPRSVALTSAELARVATGGTVRVERATAGVEGTARVLALPTRDHRRVVAVGQSLLDRDETLSTLVASFAIGGAIAVALASVLGYGLAAAGLRPVEAIRRRAREVSLERHGEPLPLPAADDEIRRLAETLNEMLDRLRRSYEREANFVADASHELRTPVAVVKAELEAALRGYPRPEAREALVAAVEECDHLAQLAEDLLVIARAGEGELPVRIGTVVAGDLLDGVRERFAERARERGRSVEVDAPHRLRFQADELRLRQALGNLVDNALRYGAGTVVLRATSDNRGVALEVSDEGPGFAPELAGRAFERFARGEAARTRGGTGLGLAIVKAIAEAHGGAAEIMDFGREAVTVRMRFPATISVSGGSKPASLASSSQPTTTGGEAS